MHEGGAVGKESMVEVHEADELTQLGIGRRPRVLLDRLYIPCLTRDSDAIQDAVVSAGSPITGRRLGDHGDDHALDEGRMMPSWSMC